MKQTLITLVLTFTFGALAQQNGFDENWFTPDIVEKKPEFALLSGDVGQPEGRFNWNADQFALMNRPQATCSGCTESGKHVAIQDLKLFVKDKEFFVKAMCYNPVPLGIISMARSSGIGGAGLCSSRRTPFAANDYKSACYDSDYADGSVDPLRTPPGPKEGWFTGLWRRDFPLIKELGANTIRIYNANPTTLLYTQQVTSGEKPAISGNIVAPVGKDHRPFFDAAQQFGLKIIFPLLGDENLMKNTPKDHYERFLENQIDEIGNHEALLMFTLGNELNIANDPILLADVNFYIGYARNYTMRKWGRKIPFTHAIVDNPSTYNRLYEQLDVDVFTSNAGYRGLGFSDLWDGLQSTGFDGLGALSARFNKPNFIGEFGWEQINGTETANPINAGWVNKKWKDLIQKGTPAGCIGGAFFEYNDEPFSKDSVLQQSMGVVSVRVSTTTEKPTMESVQVITRDVSNEGPGSSQMTEPFSQGSQVMHFGLLLLTMVFAFVIF
jgi:hypothetical protein